MLKLINKFLYDLTRTNWGLPYHFILAFMATSYFLFYAGVNSFYNGQMQIYTALFIIVAIGYEYYQIKTGKENIKGAMQDIAADLLGYVFAVLPYYIPIIQDMTAAMAFLVAIDPGHGGIAPGAVYGGIREKDINLKFAQYLFNELKKKNIDSLLTRDNDIYLNLATRCSIANANNAGLFISCHANASPSPGPKGPQIYYYSENGQKYAEKLLNAIMKVYPEKTPWTGIFKAQYYVLENTKAPAVLIELGFLSNDEDRALLSDDKFLKKVAKELAGAISEDNA